MYIGMSISLDLVASSLARFEHVLLNTRESKQLGPYFISYMQPAGLEAGLRI